MLRTPILALLAASALGGCVIYARPAPPPPPPRRVQVVRPAPPPPRGLVARTAATPVAGAGVTIGVTTAQVALRAPRITGPILFGNGSGGAFKGEAFVLPEATTRLPNLDPLVPFATLYTDSFEIRAQPFSGGFPGALRQDDWFAIRYEGNFTVEVAGPVAFELTSDDGALLYVDGQQVIDNNGVHAATTAVGSRTMTAGLHPLRLDYFQATKGQVALMLNVVEKGAGAKIVDLHPLRGTL